MDHLIHTVKSPLKSFLEFILTVLLFVSSYQLMKPYFDNLLALLYGYFIQGEQLLTKP